MTSASMIVDRKTQRYDRQLRLWGDHGQAALESARVCLINGSATGTEILKNLVLPGIGSFTVIDSEKVSGADVGNNFFLDADSIGQSRARVVTELLQELNTDVSGNFVEEPLQSLLDNDVEFFRPFTLMIATQLSSKMLARVSEVCVKLGIPFLAVRSYGLIGYLRLQIGEHCVIESHPDSPMDDLRLDRPFPELLSYLQQIDFNTQDGFQHAHIPFLAILLKHLLEWKASHGGLPPKTSKDKDEFRAEIQRARRIKEDGSRAEEENHDEAITHATKAWHVSSIPSEISALFADSNVDNLTATSSPFWIMVRSLRDFVMAEGEGLLPLRGSIPDMAADSDRYIRLQHVYQERAKHDVAAFTAHVHRHLAELGLPLGTISDDDAKTFCRNAPFLRVIRARPISDELASATSKLTDTLNFHLEDPDSSVAFYVLLRAVDLFFEEHGRFPGAGDDQVEEDIAPLKQYVVGLLTDLGVSQHAIKEELIHEMCRFGAAELHNIASILGGLASQEAVKVITRQYIPFNNTFLFNGITSTSSTVEL
ncbi:ThiF family protein [Capsaspora owczarzaki ATCC 30864]|uniref:NEDD8-activating enzyme E1 regulatory subunit n=1 Tax=Capsaspora owczarzaki (strain ATCC 30864) TaxID=595528 RepID=A0A0D2U198_CAPO3|nr:ThiF family protein [Capsaspora owczarzaki ATCC 30864]KJE88986.1 ThiF family protein [Capsaspora owczarzaki ATCC 30864]|eukprot:XP_004365421.1 ThiF family protein [Capsaspora owczarzaki ATCC 30864]